MFHASGLFVKMSSIPVESLSNQAPKFPSLLLRCNSVLILPYTIGVSTPWGTTTTPTSEELSKVNNSVEIASFPIPLNHIKATSRNHPNICKRWDLMPSSLLPEGLISVSFCRIFRHWIEVATGGSPLMRSIGAGSARGGYPERDGWYTPQQNKVLVSRFNFSTHLKHV